MFAVFSLCVPQGGVVIVQSMLLMLHSSTVFLFLGTGLLGLCISSVFPCMLALTEDILDYKGQTHTHAEVQTCTSTNTHML